MQYSLLYGIGMKWIAAQFNEIQYRCCLKKKNPIARLRMLDFDWKGQIHLTMFIVARGCSDVELLHAMLTQITKGVPNKMPAEHV